MKGRGGLWTPLPSSDHSDQTSSLTHTGSQWDTVWKNTWDSTAEQNPGCGNPLQLSPALSLGMALLAASPGDPGVGRGLTPAPPDCQPLQRMSLQGSGLPGGLEALGPWPKPRLSWPTGPLSSGLGFPMG